MSGMNSSCAYEFGISDYNLEFAKNFTNLYIIWTLTEKCRLEIKL